MDATQCDIDRAIWQFKRRGGLVTHLPDERMSSTRWVAVHNHIAGEDSPQFPSATYDDGWVLLSDKDSVVKNHAGS